MSLYIILGGVLLFFGGTLVWALKNFGKLSEKLDNYQKTEKARQKSNAFNRKRSKKTDKRIDSDDPLEPWV